MQNIANKKKRFYIPIEFSFDNIGVNYPIIPANIQFMKVLIERPASGNISALYNHTIGPNDSEKNIS